MMTRWTALLLPPLVKKYGSIQMNCMCRNHWDDELAPCGLIISYTSSSRTLTLYTLYRTMPLNSVCLHALQRSPTTRVTFKTKNYRGSGDSEQTTPHGLHNQGGVKPPTDQRRFPHLEREYSCIRIVKQHRMVFNDYISTVASHDIRNLFLAEA